MVFALVTFAVFPVFAGMMNRGPLRSPSPPTRCSPRSVGMNRRSLALASFALGSLGAFETVADVAPHGVWRHQRGVSCRCSDLESAPQR